MTDRGGRPLLCDFSLPLAVNYFVHTAEPLNRLSCNKNISPAGCIRGFGFAYLGVRSPLIVLIVFSLRPIPNLKIELTISFSKLSVKSLNFDHQTLSSYKQTLV